MVRLATLVVIFECDPESEEFDIFHSLIELYSKPPYFPGEIPASWYWGGQPEELETLISGLFLLPKEIPLDYDNKIRALENLVNGFAKHFEDIGEERFVNLYYPLFKKIAARLDKCYRLRNEHLFFNSLSEIVRETSNADWESNASKFDRSLVKSKPLPESRDIQRYFCVLYDEFAYMTQKEAAKKTLEWIEKRESLAECSERLDIGHNWDSEDIEGFRKFCEYYWKKHYWKWAADNPNLVQLIKLEIEESQSKN